MRTSFPRLSLTVLLALLIAAPSVRADENTNKDEAEQAKKEVPSGLYGYGSRGRDVNWNDRSDSQADHTDEQEEGERSGGRNSLLMEKAGESSGEAAKPAKPAQASPGEGGEGLGSPTDGGKLLQIWKDGKILDNGSDDPTVKEFFPDQFVGQSPAYFANLAAVMNEATFVSKDRSYLAGHALTAAQITAALGAGYALGKLAFTAFARRAAPALNSVAVAPVGEPLIYEVDLARYSLSQAQVSAFLRAGGAAQKDACENHVEYRALCADLAALDREIERELSPVL